MKEGEIGRSKKFKESARLFFKKKSRSLTWTGQGHGGGGGRRRGPGSGSSLRYDLVTRQNRGVLQGGSLGEGGGGSARSARAVSGGGSVFAKERGGVSVGRRSLAEQGSLLIYGDGVVDQRRSRNSYGGGFSSSSSSSSSSIGMSLNGDPGNFYGSNSRPGSWLNMDKDVQQTASSNSNLADGEELSERLSDGMIIEHLHEGKGAVKGSIYLSDEKSATCNGGILSSFLSVARNAAQQLITKSSGDTNTALLDDWKTQQDNVLDNVEHPLNTMARNTSFLRHLDFVLAANRSEEVLSSSNTNKDSTAVQQNTAHIVENSDSSNVRNAKSEGNTPDRREQTGDRSPSIIFDYHGKKLICGANGEGDVDSIRSGSSRSQFSITSFGDGDLTLDYFAKGDGALTPPERFPESMLATSTERVRSMSPTNKKGIVSSANVSSRKRCKTLPSKALYVSTLSYSESPKWNTSSSNNDTPKSSSIDKNLELAHTPLEKSGSPYREEENSSNNSTVAAAEARHFPPVRSLSRSFLTSNTRVNRCASLSFGSRGANQYLDQQYLSKSGGLSSPNVPHFDNTKVFSIISAPELEDVVYASDKRNVDFHGLFKDTEISPGEKLLSDFSCALSKDILLQGRLYVSSEHICFYSNILGYVSVVVIPLGEVVQIEKKNTAAIFPNAIAIHTLQKKYVFASFMSRDTAFDLITNVWNQIVLGPAGSHLGTQSDGSSSNLGEPGLEYKLGCDEPNEESHILLDDDDGEEYEEDSDYSTNDELSDVEKNGSSKQVISKERRGSGLSTLGPQEHTPTYSLYSPASNEHKVIKAHFSAPLGKAVNLLFGSDVSYLTTILSSQQNYNISEIKPLIGSKERSYDYCKPLSSPIGPNKATCYVTESLLHYDLEDYVKVVQISKTPDIPSGNSFYVRNVILLNWGEDNSSELVVYSTTEWTGKSWIKSTIEKASLDGVTSAMKSMVDFMEQTLNSPKKEVRYLTNEKQLKPVSILPTIGPQEHAPTSNNYSKAPGEVVVDRTNINAPLGTVFKLIYGDDSSYLRQIMDKQKNFNISDIPLFENGSRSYSYMRPLNNPLGAKQTRCLIEEKIVQEDYESYTCVEQITKTPDVPSGNSFEIHSRTYLSWGQSNSTDILIVTSITWVGRSWIKGAIEKGSLDGQKNAAKVLFEELTAIITAASSKKKGTTPRRRSSQRKRKSKLLKSNDEAPKLTAEAGSPSIISKWKSALYDMSDVSFWRTLTFIFALLFITAAGNLYYYKPKTRHEGMHTPNKITIDGVEYNLIPSINILSRLNNQPKINRRDLEPNHTMAEDSIWSWMSTRGVGPEDHNDLSKDRVPIIDI
ncbi:GRAM and VASt domain-containing protein Ecym_8163 [Eremothecium cymbalariae DBVPG|uniref:VASt domain-containing protein n=1 Tax=Eremothecium cymbalariae (strain CBS 270.75 / DBVPG 7215 / KCTC 17166 / NRRL Y-17582) TaxID=931890 RepID=G8JX76_ERECY|nr:Hypothetical protein Ecym_8163 [Eremothecium cymbalariae DBVPG\